MVSKIKTTMKLVRRQRVILISENMENLTNICQSDTEKNNRHYIKKVTNNQKVEVEHQDGEIEVVLLIRQFKQYEKANKVAELDGKTRAKVVYDAATNQQTTYERNQKSKVGVVEFATTTNPKEKKDKNDETNYSRIQRQIKKKGKKSY